MALMAHCKGLFFSSTDSITIPFLLYSTPSFSTPRHLYAKPSRTMPALTFKTSTLLSILPLLHQVSAHGFVQSITANGQSYPGADPHSDAATAGWHAANQDNGFASSLTNSDIICHNSAVPGSEHIEVTAGSTLTLTWNTWPDSHKGPMLDYLAPCNGPCSEVAKESLRFTKIDEAGLISGSNPGHWASDDMIAAGFSWRTTIPNSLAAGNYVLRHETIALHSAGQQGGAQAYPQCINLKVTGGGSNALSGGTVGTSLYTPTDPGILIDIYRSLDGYDIPGPAVGV